jgi:tol-pal system protein YbgF
MQMKYKINTLLSILIISNSIHTFANNSVTVEDRSIMLDSDVVTSHAAPGPDVVNKYKSLPQSKLNNYSANLAYNDITREQHPPQVNWQDNNTSNKNINNVANTETNNDTDNTQQPLVTYLEANDDLKDNSSHEDHETTEYNPGNNQNHNTDSEQYIPTQLENHLDPENNIPSDDQLNNQQENRYIEPIEVPNDVYNPNFADATNDELSFNTSITSDEINANAEANRMQLLRELESMSFSSRVKRLENIIETQKSQQLDRKIRILQEEIQKLRGLLESDRHQLEKAIIQQKLLYEDLDRRFSQINTSDESTASTKSFNYHDDKLAQQDLYTKAYKNIKTRDYTKAIELFNKYLENYPKGLFGANANYWLGEIYMIQSDYNKALVAFDEVMTKYPKSTKSADALYKKGLAHIYLKDFNQAKKYLKAVKKQYKNTTAARLADKQLQSIENINNDA